jgi:CDP-glucose 4,6-dehydratase
MLVQSRLIEEVTVVNGDILDRDFLRRVMAEYTVDTVFHFAAQPLVGVAKVDPVSTLEINVAGTWNVMESARQTGVQTVVAASSDKAYGASDQLPYRETHPLRGAFPYDVSKSCADLICGMYATTYGLRVGIARCANLFGGGDHNFSRTVPGCIAATLAGKRFTIRSDGKFVRDLLYIEDAAEAYLTLAQFVAADASRAGETFNFGLGQRVTVLDLVHSILGLMDRTDLTPIIENRVSTEIRAQYLSSEKAAALLGWYPRHDLAEGLRKTIAWYRDHLGYSGRIPTSEAVATA